MRLPTARGVIDTAGMGRTLIHEHVFVMTTEVQANFKTDWDEERNVEDAITKLTALKEAGIDTIVDPTVIGLGRYIPRIVEIAQQIELNIIVATGVYTYNDVPKYFRLRGPFLPGINAPDPMVDMFVTDITDGIGDTGTALIDGQLVHITDTVKDKSGRYLHRLAARHVQQEEMGTLLENKARAIQTIPQAVDHARFGMRLIVLALFVQRTDRGAKQ